MDLRNQLLKEYDDMKIWYKLREEAERNKTREHNELVNKVREVIEL